MKHVWVLIPVVVCQFFHIFYLACLEFSLWQRLQLLHTCAMLRAEGPTSQLGLPHYHCDVSYHHPQEYRRVTSHFHS